MTSTAHAVVARSPRVLSHPGPVERTLIVAVLVLLALKLPWDWFVVPVSAISVRAADAGSGSLRNTVVWTLLLIAILSRLTGNWTLVGVALKHEKLIVAFVGMAVASILWSVDPALTTRRVVSLVLSTLLATLLAVRYPLREVARMVGLALLIGLVICVVWIVVLPKYGIDSQGRWTGVFDQKNPMGRFATLGAVVFAVNFIDDSRRRLIWAAGTVSAVVLVVGSASKTSLGGLVLLAALTLTYRGFRARRTAFGAMGVGLVAASSAALLFVTDNIGLFTKLVNKDITFTGRTELWQSVWTAIMHRPVFGYGWAAFWGGWLSPARDVWLTNQWQPPHAHNGFLDAALQLGLVGAAVYALLVVRTLIGGARLVRARRDTLGLLPMIMATWLLLFSLTETSVESRSLYWVLFVYSAIWSRVEYRRIESSGAASSVRA